ncbi:CRISPR-associated endonuclease Cas1 [Methanosalsum natronophilum]|uniref:CRISPR-associated endonuclease Cas1 n=1 Tax=Methanosalsum natronophilum TaxID=768733 RepID=UPI002168E24C|nr:CRISPR-associated endonuclease Cas1 [Methanosalsum natronophilum]MCS3923889.1 CRISPR-associated protein Cas1 [Methanosalsum natronophilum]
MQLVINSYGSFLKKQNNCFLVKKDDDVFEVSANKVQSILISTSSTITTDAIEFAIENNIDIVFLNKFGYPFGRVWHSKLGSTTLIRRRQIEIANTQKGIEMAKSWIDIKLANQISLLKDLKKNRADKKEFIDENIRIIGNMQADLSELKGTLDEIRNNIMGLEGMSSRAYFDAISYSLPDRWSFSGRSRQPATDGFNCMLNYGYGVLYSIVEKACIIAGLDPYVGFLHTDNYNKKSLVFDLIEMYRIYVDRSVIFLFSKKKVKDTFFDTIPNGLTLNKEGKVLLIESLNISLDNKIPYNGRNVKVRNVIQHDLHKIANSLIK